MLPGFDEVRTQIKAMRTQHSLTQQEAATLAQVSQSFVAKLEQGSTHPNYADVARLYNALDTFDGETVTARDLMQPDVISVAPDETVHAASATLKRYEFSQLPVMQASHCVGSITSTALLAAEDMETVRSVMTDPFPEVRLDTPKRAVIELLADAPAVLVHDADGVTGIITAADLI